LKTAPENVHPGSNCRFWREFMPIYEYRCIECQQLFEEWHKRAEDSARDHNCPICKGQARRIISNTSFSLKGGGWYATEYGPKRNEGKNDGSAPCFGPASSEAPTACAPSESCSSAAACNAAVATPA
jgi:putative FmdB family regulatory protein